MKRELNLATRPFLNPRPVLRVTLLLWALGALVAAFNIRLYVSHYSGSSEIRGRQQQLESSLEGERMAVRELESELAGFDLVRQNEQSSFLNAKIAERSFSWSELFDRLGEVMPANVRLTSLSPSFESDKRRGRTETRENEVLLGIRAIAKSSAEVLEFIDALFGHPSFRAPNLVSESRQDTGLVEINLSVIYDARSPEAEVVTASETTVEELVAEDAAPASASAVGGPAAADDPPAATGGEGRSE